MPTSSDTAIVVVQPSRDLNGQVHDEGDQTEELGEQTKSRTEVEAVEDEDAKKEPLAYIRFVVKRPKLCCAIGCVLLIAISVTALALIAVGYIAINPVVPLDDWSSVPKQREDSYESAINNRGNPDDVQESQSMPHYFIGLLYRGQKRGYLPGDRPSLRVDDLYSMRKIENKVMRGDEYDKFCATDSDGLCLPPNSLLKFFFTYDTPSMQWIGDTNQTHMDRVFEEMWASGFTGEYYKSEFFVDQHFGASSLGTEYTRTTFYQGLPLTRIHSDYKNDFDEGDNLKDQRTRTENWQCRRYLDYLWHDATDGTDVELLFGGSGLLKCMGLIFATRDAMLAFGSLVFVFFFAWIQTHSLWLASCGMAQILSSFPIAMLVYRLPLQISYFGTFNLMAIFIILAIGADNVFVFVDAFQQSKARGDLVNQSLAHRLSWAFRRAVGAMFVTSFTTFAAFVATAASSLVGIQTFGIFAAMLVGANFVLILTFFPSVLAVYAIHFEGHFRFCACFTRIRDRRGERKQSIGKVSVTEVELASMRSSSEGDADPSDVPTEECLTERTAAHEDDSLAVPGTVVAQTDKSPTKSVQTMEKLFREYYAPLLVRLRWFVLVAMLGVTIFFLLFAIQMEPDPDRVDSFPKDNILMQYIDKSGSGSNPDDSVFYRAPGAEPSVKVNFVWGLKERPDRDDQDRYDPESMPKPRWDGGFDPNLTPEQQEFFLTVCDRFGTSMTSDVNSCLRPGEVGCFMEAFRDWVRNETELSFPVPQDKFVSMLRDFTGPEYSSYNKEFRNEIGFVSGDLKYLAIYVNTTLDKYIGLIEGEKKYGKFNDVMDDINGWAKAEGFGSLSNAFQMTDYTWAWVFVQRILFNSAFINIAVAMVLAFLVLSIAAHNPIVAALATVNIGCIVIALLGTMVLMGWKMAVVQSISCVLIVGFSVDYTVHYAHAYVESNHTRRSQKVIDALGDMGVSVVSGAVSTMGACAFLLFAEIVFFVLFGTFILITIAFAFFFATVLFMALLATFGPEGAHEDMLCDTRPWLRACRARMAHMCRKNKDSQEETDDQQNVQDV